MVKKVIIWLVAFIITAGTAIYQRSTGPTYPVQGETVINGHNISYKFQRSHGGETDHTVKVTVDKNGPDFTLYYKRYKTDDQFTAVPMEQIGTLYRADLPHQPPAGKLEYYVEATSEGKTYKITDDNVVIRFKGEVPILVLIPHIIAMFAAMMLAAYTGLQIFTKEKQVEKLAILTIAVLGVGGFILGPMIQEYAFGDLWTGFPFGLDLTDNKTLIAMLAWVIAYTQIRRTGDGKKGAAWATFAAIVMFAVYLIPHSMMGSELDYNKLDTKQNTEITNQQ